MTVAEENAIFLWTDHHNHHKRQRQQGQKLHFMRPKEDAKLTSGHEFIMLIVPHNRRHLSASEWVARALASDRQEGELFVVVAVRFNARGYNCSNSESNR